MFNLAILSLPGEYACHASTDSITLLGPSDSALGHYYRVTVACLGAYEYFVRDLDVAACIWRSNHGGK